MSSTTVGIEEFLAAEQQKELLRFTTAGSVDDGKSTLIGRLLYDSKGVYEDQLAAVTKSAVNRSTGPIDFSLITDGLRAEREQGITIDVAYRYFSTPRRKFIIADTPGHEQYTRNMATGASTAELAIVLVDARKGVLPQSRRHAFIASLLGIPNVVVAVNKMDLVYYSAEVFHRIRADFEVFARELGLRDAVYIPISALEGDNVVAHSNRTPWYHGPNLLEHLETVPIARAEASVPMRFPVQYVIRPSLDFRGYAGQVAAGELRAGDRVMVLPSGRTSRITRIATWDGDLESASAPMSVTVCLADEIDVSRGDMLVPPGAMPHVSRRLEAMLVWMHADALQLDRPYLIKHTTQQVPATFTRITYKVDVNTLGRLEASRLELNEIGQVGIETHRPLFYDAYRRSRATGSFIVIDPVSNVTVGAGMLLERPRQERGTRLSALSGVEFEQSRVTPGERYGRSGHYPVTVWLTARRDLAYLVERMLFDRGCSVHVLADDFESHLLPELARMSAAVGLITICSVASAQAGDRESARDTVGVDHFVAFEPEELPARDDEAAQRICRVLEDRGFLGTIGAGLSGEGI
ncbi:MAG TPA: sulfate adenylyltransferase subunit CysN [Bryobacteraceae bacterium]|nr:sulfate adenylyltransferase subunit CysN [Bryobacteraceae bacterium]